MKSIEIDDELYQFIVTKTQFIGESASSILRRLLNLSADSSPSQVVKEQTSLNEEKKALSLKDTEQLSVQASVINNNASNEKIKQVIKKVTTQGVTNKESVFNFINKEELAMQRSAVGRFLLILAALFRAHPDEFFAVNDICGRNRLYFASSEQALIDSGNSTNPRQIGKSSFWVITNSNTTRKKMILTKVASLLGYSESDVEKIRELL